MTDDSRRRYTKRELQNLWASGFDGVDDEAERLAGFADCPTEQAEAMIESFRKTAAAQKAAAAEESRKRKPPRLKKDTVPAETEELKISEPFPAESIVSAAINAEHSLSIVEAEAHSRDRARFLCVERVNRCGMPCHRLKLTTYHYFRSREEALQAARQHRMKLTVYDTPK